MKLTSLAIAAGAASLLASAANAQLSDYSQDFEGLAMGDPAALGADNWDIFANVFDSGGGYLYGYGVFDAPNGGAGFSAIATGSGGAAQGAQYVNIYSDYANADQDGAGLGAYIEANVFQEMSPAAGDVGATYRFAFDYLKNPTPVNGDGDTQTFAFIKVLKSSDGSFATLLFDQFDTTGASDSAWASHMMDVVIDASYAGEILQFGFASLTTNYNDSGRFYDNVSFTDQGGGTGGGPELTAYAQDFEALGMADPAALTNDGWKIFANVFDAGFGYLYGYGVFDAPNGGAGFSAIGTGDGGPAQGAQYFNAYSDYGNGDHGVGNIINALVFQEQTPGMANIGQTWRLSFDTRKNPLVVNGDGATTTFAFIKVIKSSDGSFATLFEKQFDSTNISDATWSSMALDIPIDAAYVGEIVQFGFGSFASNFEDSGRYYDNLDWNVIAAPGLGEVVCLGNPSSTGSASLLTITGSDVAADNNLTLSVDGLPANAMGYFVHSMGGVLLYNPAGSQGHLCIASLSMGRFAGNVLDSGATGSVSLSPDLGALPVAMGTEPVLAGQTRSFQYWTRDMSGGAPTSNFSSAASVTFQ